MCQLYQSKAFEIKKIFFSLEARQKHPAWVTFKFVLSQGGQIWIWAWWGPGSLLTPFLLKGCAGCYQGEACEKGESAVRGDKTTSKENCWVTRLGGRT